MARATNLAILLGVLGLVGVVAGMPTRDSLPVAYRQTLERLLRQGPDVGRWRIEDAFGVRARAIAPSPVDPDRLLVGRVDMASPSAPVVDLATAPARRVRAYTRERLVALVSEAPPDLFFRNYEPAGPAVRSTAEGGAAALRVDWVPRHPLGGDTSRHVWHDRRTMEVIQVEDRSYHGRLLHGLYRLSKDPGPLEKSDRPRPGDGRGPWKPRSVADAPFTVLAPTYLPPGFERTGSGFHEWPAPGGRSERGGRKKVGVAMFTYSDGLAFLSVHVATREDMDAMQAFAEKIDQNRARADTCPSLPDATGDVTEGTLVIRRRADLCRTVLRVDGIQGSSVAVIGRNEVPGDEYIRVIRSLAAEPAPPR